MLAPWTYTFEYEGVKANLWIVTFTEKVFTYEEGIKIIVKYAIYSYN